MILHFTLGALAFLSLGLLLWQWFAAIRFPLHERRVGNSFTPAVTLLKSLKGCDDATGDCLRSWLRQEYPGEVQILFGIASPDDPAGEVVHKLQQEFPGRDAQLVVCGPPLGVNAKVSKLAELQKLAKHDVWVVSDADVRVPPDLLVNAVGALTRSRRTGPMGAGGDEGLEKGEVGLVNCFYRLANPSTLAMQWEAVAINADFWSQVLQSRSLQSLDFALGAAMAIRRKEVEEIGGFAALADCLADDYQLGNRITRNGYRIALCPVVVECWDPPMSWRAVWRHQMRWARTIRVCQPAPYFFSILSNPTLWPLLWLLGNPSLKVGGIVAGCIVVRMLAAFDLQRRLTQSKRHWVFAWLAPVKDLLQSALWVSAFVGNRIEWRGHRYRLRSDGILIKE